jgi:FKBP-type peptidyl-prolyl cis-trans isomerase
VKGVAGMKRGGVRTMTIPPALAFGATGATLSNGNKIPPNATVTVELVLEEVSPSYLG